jgi:hypothetical protein
MCGKSIQEGKDDGVCCEDDMELSKEEVIIKKAHNLS